MGKLIKIWAWVWRSLAVGFLVLCIIVIIASFFQKDEKATVEKKTLAVKTERKPINQDFVYAVPGEVWIINEDNIPLVDTPQTFTDRDQFNAHLNCIIKSGSKVEIIKHKVIGNWKYVRVLSGFCSGWVSGHTVKKARKV